MINCSSQKNVTDSLIVEIESGKIRGIEQQTIFDEKKFYAFRGIPYAKPPIGERRFLVCIPLLLLRPRNIFE